MLVMDYKINNTLSKERNNAHSDQRINQIVTINLFTKTTYCLVSPVLIVPFLSVAITKFHTFSSFTTRLYEQLTHDEYSSEATSSTCSNKEPGDSVQLVNWDENLSDAHKELNSKCSKNCLLAPKSTDHVYIYIR